jgi:hypothetical protein
MNSRKLKSAVALALVATLVGYRTASAMNKSKHSASNSFSSKTGCLSEKSAKQENMLKKLWPLWSALGVGAVGLIAWGLYKAFKPGDKDSPDGGTKGEIFIAKESGENLKKKCTEKNMENKLDNLIDQIESQKVFKDNFDKDLENNKLGLSNTCDIYFDNEGNFECYDLTNKNKVELNGLEKLVVKEISDLFFKELAIKPARVNRSTHNFYFSFNIDGSIQGNSYFSIHRSAFKAPLKISVTA